MSLAYVEEYESHRCRSILSGCLALQRDHYVYTPDVCRNGAAPNARPAFVVDERGREIGSCWSSRANAAKIKQRPVAQTIIAGTGADAVWYGYGVRWLAAVGIQVIERTVF